MIGKVLSRHENFGELYGSNKPVSQCSASEVLQVDQHRIYAFFMASSSPSVYIISLVLNDSLSVHILFYVSFINNILLCWSSQSVGHHFHRTFYILNNF